MQLAVAHVANMHACEAGCTRLPAQNMQKLDSLSCGLGSGTELVKASHVLSLCRWYDMCSCVGLKCACMLCVGSGLTVVRQLREDGWHEHDGDRGARMNHSSCGDEAFEWLGFQE